MSADSGNSELLQFLERANLMSYKEALLEQGFTLFRHLYGVPRGPQKYG